VINEINPIPNVPQSDVTTASQKAVKVARPDIIFSEKTTLPEQVMFDLIYESLSGQEIISLTRNDLINGQNVSYGRISNARSLSIEYNPKNIFTLPGTSSLFFNSFAIKFEEHVPEEGTGPINPGNGLRKTVYLDEDSYDLVINVTGLQKSDNVEIQVLNAGMVVGDTMYSMEES
jgi:hypothetical protein